MDRQINDLLGQMQDTLHAGRAGQARSLPVQVGTPLGALKKWGPADQVLMPCPKSTVTSVDLAPAFSSKTKFEQVAMVSLPRTALI